MAIYNINNTLLSVVYDRFGVELDSAYDAGGNEIYSKRTLTSISVSYSGGTVEAGTTLDQLTGVEVTAIYNDGTTQSVADYSLSGELIPGQENSITVTYQGQTSSFIVTVNPVPKVLTGITVSYSGGNVPAGTTLDQLQGITVTAVYNDGSTEMVNDYALEGTLTPGANNQITVSYQGFSDTFTVTVDAAIVYSANRTYSAGDISVTVDEDVDEQVVSIEDGTMAFVAYPDFPAFENAYLECPSSLFPYTVPAGGGFRDQKLAGYVNFTSGVQYFCAAHCITEGTVLKGTASSYVAANSLNGTGWFYWTQTGSPYYADTFTCSHKTVIDKLYAFPMEGDYANNSLYGFGIARYFGELDITPGQNFPGRATNGVVTIYKNGEAIGTNSDITSLRIKAGDILRCDGGALVFRVGVNAENPLTEVHYVAVGDSLTDATINADYKYHAIIKDGVGLKSVPAYGKGSTGYKQGYNGGYSYWQRIADIPHDADVVTIFGSVNDWNYSGTSSADQTGNVTDNLSTGQTSLAAYINATLDVVKKRAPLAKTVMVTELYYKGPEYADYRINKQKAIGTARGISVYDLYNDTYEGKGFSDGTNPYANTVAGMGLNFQQITDAAFGREYTVDYSTTANYGHPSNSYHLQWLAPKFADIICKELGLSTSLLPDDLRIDT